MEKPDPVTNNTILVVEDDPQAAKLLFLYLAQAGYEVLIAQNGGQALQLAVQHQPLAITLDLLLPDMDGWQVLTELKTTPSTRHIPVVIISVLDRQALSFDLGARDYLVKPVKRAGLLNALRRCISRDGETNDEHRVMLVHSNLAELNLLAVMLEHENYRVVQALGTAEAVNLAKCMHPDLVVTDLLTGEMDFFGLLDALRACSETAHIPLLVLSKVSPDAAGRNLDAGRIEFVLLQKNEPIEGRLLEAITMLFRRTE